MLNDKPNDCMRRSVMEVEHAGYPAPPVWCGQGTVTRDVSAVAISERVVGSSIGSSCRSLFTHIRLFPDDLPRSGLYLACQVESDESTLSTQPLRKLDGTIIHCTGRVWNFKSRFKQVLSFVPVVHRFVHNFLGRVDPYTSSHACLGHLGVQVLCRRIPDLRICFLLSFHRCTLELCISEFSYSRSLGLPGTNRSLCCIYTSLLLDSVAFVMISSSLRKLYKRSPRRSPLLNMLVRDGLLFYAATVVNSVAGIISWTVYNQSPQYFFNLAVTFPLVNIAGQRLVLNLRGFRPHPPSTREIDHEVNRQIAEMRNLSFWRSRSRDGQPRTKSGDDSE